MNLLSLLLSPLSAILLVPFGMVSFVTPFGFIFSLPVIAGSILSLFFFTKNQKQVGLFFILSIGLGQLMALFSWIFSRQDIPPSQALIMWGENLPSVATAGFPFTALELPPPPMGADYIPVEMVPEVLLNQIVWLLIGLFLGATLSFLIKQPKKQLLYSLIVVSWLLVFYNLGVFLIWFD